MDYYYYLGRLGIDDVKTTLNNFYLNEPALLAFLFRSTLIVEKNIVKKIFYPILSIEKHIKEMKRGGSKKRYG